VVKIKKLLLALSIFMILAASLASAVTVTNISNSKLNIRDIEVTVDGSKDSSVSQGDEVGPDVKPQSTIKMEFKFENLFSTTEDIDIQDITATVIIRDIDDGEDLEEEISDFDLKPGREKTQRASFTAPLKIDEGLYDVDVEVEASDENNTDYDLVWTFQLNVDKEKHKVIIHKKELSSPEIQIGKSADLTLGIINIGQEDEDDVTLEVTSKELGLNKKETFSMSADIDDEDNAMTRAYTIRPENVEPGIYSISIKASYQDGDKVDTATQSITVLAAPQPTPEEVVVVTAPQAQEPIMGEVLLPTYIPPVSESETPSLGFLNGNMSYIALIGLAYVIVIVVGVVVAVRMFRKE